MGAIQSSINNMLGTAGTVSALAQHLGSEKKELAIKKIEAERDVMNANEALLKNDAQYLNEQELEKGLAHVTDADSYLEGKRDEAESDYNEASLEKMMRDFNYEMGIQKSKPGSKRLEKAMQAYENVQDEIMARKNLKFDLEVAQKKLKALGGNK